MLKLGIIGLNEGNGHPYSYAAIINGYDHTELMARCPYGLIREYLPRDHGNKQTVDMAKVTHIWTQDRTLSENVAKVSLIPNVVEQLEDMAREVDAVILARDDPWNHLEMARPFLQRGMPIFIDKQLAANPRDLAEILSLAGPSYPLMAGSPARFTRDLERAKKVLDVARVRSIHGMSRVSWMRYGHHVFEGIAVLFGTDVLWVRSLSMRAGHDIVQIKYASGPSVILEFVNDIALPIQFTCFSEGKEPLSVPFADFYHSFREMLLAFLHLVRTGERVFPYEEMVTIANVVMAGDLSKQAGGVAFCPRTLTAVVPVTEL